MPTNRNFGITFGIVFLIISTYPLINGNEIFYWSLILSIIFFILGILNSNILNPLNKIWFKIGIFLGNIVSPLVMGLVFFIVVTPIGLIMKILKKDILKLKKNNSQTYWIKNINKSNDLRKQF